MTTPAPLLATTNLAKHFGTLPVLRGVSVSVAPGEVVGVTASHGGGKSVLMGILGGAIAPSQGEMQIAGRRMRWPFRPQAAGVAVIHQEPELVEQLDVIANLFLGAEVGWPGLRPFRVINPARMEQRAGELLARLDAQIANLHEPVTNLASEQRHLVAMARALLHPARLVLVDEPTLPLGSAYQQTLLALIRAWQAEGAAVVFSSNNLDHLFAVAGRIVVLRQGRSVADLPTAATDREGVVAALVGTPDPDQVTPLLWALDSYYHARAQAEQLGQQRTLLEQNLAAQVAALDSAHLALQDAHRRLLTEREQERKALARELHDGVIQDLLGVNFQLEQIADADPTQAEGLTAELTDVRTEIRGLVEAVRRICGTLRPPTIDSLGLGAALQSYTRDWTARTGIAVKLDLDGDLGRLPEPLELSIFRIVQEGLSNVRKHAQASEVQISLRARRTGTLTIAIRDNGHGLPRGFDMAALAAAGHYGVLGISERVALMEGRLHLHSPASGGGTVLRVEIPDPRPRLEKGA